MVKHYCSNCGEHQFTEKIGTNEGWFSICSVCGKKIKGQPSKGQPRELMKAPISSIPCWGTPEVIL